MQPAHGTRFQAVVADVRIRRNDAGVPKWGRWRDATRNAVAPQAGGKRNGATRGSVLALPAKRANSAIAT